jgi:hypothetical protein
VRLTGLRRMPISRERRRRYGQPMPAFRSKVAIVVAVVAITSVVSTGSVQADHGAVDIEPDNSDIFAFSENATFTYEGVDIVCPESMLSGTTDLAAQDVVNFKLSLGPPGECTIAGLSASMTCSSASGSTHQFGTARWHVLTAGTGEIDRLNEGFFCTVEVAGVCEVGFEAQDLPILGGVNRADPTSDGIELEVDADASSNNPVCGPSRGVLTWTGVYVFV